MDRSKLLLKDISFSEDTQEYVDTNKQLVTKVISFLQKQTLSHLFFLVKNPESFKLQGEKIDKGEEFTSFIKEVTPKVIMLLNGWNTNEFNNQFSNYLEDDDVKLNRPRLKACKNCGKDLTEEFALELTAEDIISGEKVAVLCPNCNTMNYLSF